MNNFNNWEEILINNKVIWIKVKNNYNNKMNNWRENYYNKQIKYKE